MRRSSTLNLTLASALLVTLSSVTVSVSAFHPSLPVLHPGRRLQGRQAADSGSDLEPAGDADLQIDPKCLEQCQAFDGVVAQCESSTETTEAEDYACACRTEVFQAMIQCLGCASDMYSDFEGGSKGFVENALQECSNAGHPVDNVDTSSLPTGTGTLSAFNLPSTAAGEASGAGTASSSDGSSKDSKPTSTPTGTPSPSGGASGSSAAAATAASGASPSTTASSSNPNGGALSSVAVHSSLAIGVVAVLVSSVMFLA